MSAKDVLNRDKDVRLIQSNQVKRGTLVKQCSKKNSDLSRLWTDTLCELKLRMEKGNSEPVTSKDRNPV